MRKRTVQKQLELLASDKIGELGIPPFRMLLHAPEEL